MKSIAKYAVIPSKKPTGKEMKKKKTAGVYTPYCDHMTILTWNMMGSATILDELREIADQKKPWVIVMTETTLTDIKQDRLFFEPYLPEYKLYHSCGEGNSGHCRPGSGGVTVAVHNSLTTQISTETISHNHPAAKAYRKTLKIKPSGSDCLTRWGVYLPIDDMQKREQLYQVVQNDVKLEADKAARAGLPQPYDVMAGDMNAALFTGDVQRTQLDMKDIRHQNFA